MHSGKWVKMIVGPSKAFLATIFSGVLVSAATAVAQGMPGDPIIVVPQQEEMPGEALIIEPADDADEGEPKEEPGVFIERAPRLTPTNPLESSNTSEDGDAERLAKRFKPVRKPTPPSTRNAQNATAIPAAPSATMGDGNLRQAVIPLNGIELSGVAVSALRRRGFAADGENIVVSWPAPDRGRAKLVSEVKDEPLNFYGEFFECRTGQRYVCGLTVDERQALASVAARSQDENCPIELSDNATTFTPSTSGDRGAFLDGPVIDIMDVMKVIDLWDRGEFGVPEWAAFMNASCNRACGRPGIYRAMSWRPGGLEYVHRGYKTAFASCSAR